MALTLDVNPGFLNSINFPITWKFSDTSPPAGDYYLEVQVTDKGHSTDYGSPEKVFFNSEGDAYFNAAIGIIQHFGQPDFEFDYADYKISESVGSAYSIKYRTVNDGSPSSWVEASSFNNFIQATPNLRFLPNYEDYYSKLTDADKCKFLTHFERPTKWYGYPFSLAMIGLQDSNTDHQPGAYDSDGNFLNSAYIELPGSSVEPFTHLNIPDLHIDQDTIQTLVTYNVVGGNATTETKTIDCEQPPCRPFYVRWLNEFGAYDQHMFQDPEFNTNRSEGPEISANEWFYEQAKGAINASSLDIADTVTVGSGNVSYQKLKGIGGIMRSRRIQWLQDLPTKRWVNIGINTADIPQDTNQEGLDNATIEFRFPKIYTN